MAKSQKPASASRRYLFWVVLGIVAYLAAELFSLLSLYLLREAAGIEYSPIRASLSERHDRIVKRLLSEEAPYMQHDPLLGWSIRKNGTSANLMYRANSDGIRADREYRLSPEKGVLRIASFGDSFTHCDDVSNENTWQEIMAKLEPGLEVINFGVGGYGSDQAFLRYQRDGLKYHPHVVLIGFMSENINRHVSVFRPFYHAETGLPFTKPRFLLTEDGITLKPNPLNHISDYARLIRDPGNTLPGLGSDDWHFHHQPRESALDFLPSVRLARLAAYRVQEKLSPQILENGTYNEASEAFAITLKIFDRFHESVMEQGAQPIIVLFPNRNDLRRYRETNRNVFAPLLRYFREAGYRYIDLDEAFDRYASDVPLEELFVGHYSPAANRAVARYLADYFSRYRLSEHHQE